jgi:hypothetical protein
MSNPESTQNSFLEETKAKFPLLEINPELARVMPQDEVIELVNACVSLSGYTRNDIKNALFRALSLPALNEYVNIDKRFRVAIDIVVNGLENRFPDKPKIEYEWKGESSHLSVLESIDEYGNGLFTEYWMPEPVISALNGEWILDEPEASVSDGWIDALEVHDVLVVRDAPEVRDVLEVHDAPELMRSSPFPVKKKTKKASEASNSFILAEILQELKEIKAILRDKK